MTHAAIMTRDTASKALRCRASSKHSVNIVEVRDDAIAVNTPHDLTRARGILAHRLRLP